MMKMAVNSASWGGDREDDDDDEDRMMMMVTMMAVNSVRWGARYVGAPCL